MIAVNAALDNALFSLLRGGDSTPDTQRALTDAFTAAIHCAAGGDGAAADISRAADAFLASPQTTPLEQLFVRVATALHCHTMLSTACDAPTCADGAALPHEVKAAAMALAAALSVCERRLWYGFLCVFLQQLSARGGDFGPWRQFFQNCAAQAGPAPSSNSPDESDGQVHKESEEVNEKEGNPMAKSAALWAAVSDEMFAATVARTRFRRTAILCKSFAPHMVAQAPGTTHRLLRVLHAFMDEWNELQSTFASRADEDCATRTQGEECDNDENNIKRQKAREEEMIRRHGEAFCHIISEGQVHAFLTATVFAAVISSTYILSRRTGTDAQSMWFDVRPDAAKEAKWRVARFPPFGRLLDVAGIRPLLSIHLFAVGTQLRIGLSHTHHVEGRQTLALCLYATELCSLRTALAIYHCGMSITLAPNKDTMPGAELAALSAAVGQYAHAARNELVFAPITASGGAGDSAGIGLSRRRPRSGREALAPPEAEAGVGVGAGTVEKERDEPLPVAGEAVGPRFSRMVFPVPCPSWQSFLAEETRSGGTAAAAATTTTTTTTTAMASAVSPCKFVLDLLAMGLPALAARTIAQLRTEAGVDVCLVPGAAMGSANSANSGNSGVTTGTYTSSSANHTNSNNSASANAANTNANGMSGGALSVAAWIMRHVEEMLVGDATHVLKSLETFFPLLATIPTYVASQAFLCVLLQGIDEACERFLHNMRKSRVESGGSRNKKEENNDDNNKEEEEDKNQVEIKENKDDEVTAKRCRWALGIVELYLMRVVMPCMRVLSPSPILYDRVHVLLSLICREGYTLHFGESPAEFLHTRVWMESLLRPQAPRAPHDVLRSKELDTLFTQSLKRMTNANVGRYRELLRPVIYANPLLVAEKLFQQAVGYGNNFLRIHTQLLMGAPAAVMTLVIHAGLNLMRNYAEKERIGTNDANRVGLIATFLAVLWRDNPLIFNGTLLLRAAEYALRREARASIVFGLELLKALLHEMLDVTLEHEEQYSVAQVRALLAPPSTEWFAKGAAESFRRGRWDEVLTPAVLAASGNVLRAALLERCAVPLESYADELSSDEGESQQEKQPVVEKEDDDDNNEETVVMALGQWILLHLCRLHSKVYTIQADLAGTMELILLTCARDYNVINDLLLCLEAQLPEGPPLEQLLRVAMPHVALRLTARFDAKKQQQQQQQQQQQAQQQGISGGREKEKEKGGGGGASSNSSSGGGEKEELDQKDSKSNASSPNSTSASLLRPVVEAVFAVSPNTYHYDDDVDDNNDDVNNKNNNNNAEEDEEKDITNKTHNSNISHKKRNPWRIFKPIGGVIPFSLLRLLSRYTAAHFVFDDSIYASAAKEIHCFFNHAHALLKQKHRALACDISAHISRDPTVRWLQAQTRHTRLEKDAHRRLYEECTAAHGVLLEELRRGGVFRSPVAFAVSYLLPRALLSLEDTLFVAHFLRWLLDAARPIAEEYEAAVCALLSLITAAMTFFVGLTDGECKRVGLLMSLVLTDMREDVEMPPHPQAQAQAQPQPSQCAVHSAQSPGDAMTAAAAHAVGDTIGTMSLSMDALMAHLEPKPRALIDILSPRNAHSDRCKNSGNSASNQDGGDDEKEPESPTLSYNPPAYPLQLEAYLCRALVQLLVHQKDNAFIHRNALLVLERLVKRDPPFPSTVSATAWLIRAVAPHAVRSSSCYASATAVLKILQDSQRRKQSVLQEATPSPLMIASGYAAARPEEEAWRKHWATREAYMHSLLAADMDAAAWQRKDRCEDNDNDEEGNGMAVPLEEEEEEEEEVVNGVDDEVPEPLDEDLSVSCARSEDEDPSPEDDEDDDEEEEDYERDEEEYRHGDASSVAGSEDISVGSAPLTSGRKRPRDDDRNRDSVDEDEAHMDGSNEEPVLSLAKCEKNSEEREKEEL